MGVSRPALGRSRGAPDALLVVRIAPLELFQNPNLNFARLAVLLDGTDDLDGVLALRALAVDAFHHFTKGAFAELAHDPVCGEGKEKESIG